MFNFIKKNGFHARIQAELRAQCNKEELVNEICCRASALKIIKVLRRKAYYRHDRIAPFMAVCALLGDAINDTSLSEETRLYCASLLHKRLEKVDSDPQFRMQHLMIFGELEEKMIEWTHQNRELAERTLKNLGPA